ncbi:N-acetylglucosamine-6-phosphate deacetylase [Lasiodiplodia theobromae]|uniref:N-acetylglucosamine-6-phosphate deacetylase n=1 Tax=Lasiodiplodia theobromae TaxID=45133 RepID=A0A5N5D4C0_9PEZI|nr:N-acetylglucosamine-6-phosphate deacetylase [Lasiodiplodia theobromae]KAB2572529.1 N-acetylglucosamine-6-phosphate deacetylase [Lasiodiplodia theobromae]KAF4536042.1 N-acetylglucosamine-6-phosphate deacetylase [Lasiodiplodia theobromae]
MSDNQFTLFTNGSYCLGGEIVDDHLVISEETGRILKRTGYIGGEIVDLEGNIVAPGFLELHTNGVNGFHFTHFDDERQYDQKLKETAEHYVSQGVTGFWATIPTVSPDTFQKILPSLQPRYLSPSSAYLHGAHAEGPYLHPSKAGAHNASLFHTPSTTPSPTTIYGATGLRSVKLATLAPELPSSTSLINTLTTNHSIRVSLGHTTATYADGLAALGAGATCLTHTLNAMTPLHSRQPGLAGLISLPPPPTKNGGAAQPQPQPPYYTLIADGHHLHPSTVSLLYRANPSRAILVSDSIELASPAIPAGTYPGHAQISSAQRKVTHDPVTGEPYPSPKAVIAANGSTTAAIDDDASNETLIGGCGTLAEAVRNLVAWTGCTLPEAVRTVTENVAGLMGVDTPDSLEGGGVGVLKEGNRADLVVLSEEGEVLQTWMSGRMVWEREGGL